ncbi:MAG: hypothetical protein HY676_04040 [Chloroflexi bacterium]|nr:hypothetical protein [Chloroflexota bacterium]
MKSWMVAAGLALILMLAAGCIVSTSTPSPPSPTPTPTWQNDLILKLSREPVVNPPASIIQYEYKDQVVYYVPPRCCDIFSDLYDANGNLLGHPDGGITGRGDGKFPDFLQERKGELVVWQDEREYDPQQALALAPIESVEVIVLESAPPQYSAVVVSGLPNSCVTFAGYRVKRSDATIEIEVLNWRPVDTGVLCAQVYGTVRTVIPLGSDFQPGTTYTIMVNGVEKTFVAEPVQ